MLSPKASVRQVRTLRIRWRDWHDMSASRDRPQEHQPSSFRRASEAIANPDLSEFCPAHASVHMKLLR